MILIKGKLYDFLKFLAQIVLPAFGTLYFTLAGIWHLPGAQEVVNTVIAVDTFLGVILHLSSTAYDKTVEDGGELHVNEGQLLFQLDGDKTDVDKLGEKSEVRFKVKKKPKKAAE
jgi:Putative phage holin Dp-1